MTVATASALGTGALDVAIAGAAGAAAAAWLRPRAAYTLLAAAAGALAISTAILSVALVRSDFSLAYVADNSRASSSAPYRLAGLWAGTEGSLLFWSALLALVCAVTRRAAGIAAALIAALAVIARFAADPFARLDLPAIQGSGLTPVLEHPAMLYHPALLYLGLACTIVPFLSTASYLQRRTPLDERWAQSAHRALALATAVLTAGLLAGANWSYAELGWGGFWAWDPIENGALVPWLAAIAGLHLLRARPRRTAAAAVLSLAPFPLTMIGVVITRSGATVSVHSFAESRTIGWSLLAVTAAVTAIAVVFGLRLGPLASVRPRSLRAPGQAPVWAVAPLVAALAIVLLGTLAPVVGRLLGRDGTPTDGRYYARLSAPIAVAALVLVAIVPSRVQNRRAPRRAAAVGAVGACIGLLISGERDIAVVVLFLTATAAAAASIVLVAVSPTRRSRAGHVAHCGFALLMLGVAGSAAATTISGPLAPGQPVDLAGYTFLNRGVEVVPGPHPGTSAVQASIDILRNGHSVTTLRPSLVAYPNYGILLAESALSSRIDRDVQIVLRTADDSGVAVVDIGVRPWVRLVWLGAALIALGVAVLVVPPGRSRRVAPPLAVE